MILATWALSTSFIASYYWLQYTDIRDRISGAIITVNLGIDFGNNTRIWHNNTKTITGSTLFDVTKQVTNITYKTGIYGTEILSIENVTKEGSFGWTYWIWNSSSQSWLILWENVDKHLLSNHETFMWYYQNAFNPPS